MSSSPCRSGVVGDALRTDAADLLGAVNSSPALQRYAMALMTRIARSAACNRLHDVEQRASRRLLHTHDRVDGDAFRLTPAFLSQMLGEDAGAVHAATERLPGAG